jgi:hypothetical protein
MLCVKAALLLLAAMAEAGFVRVQRNGSVWWFEHDGRHFFSTGVSNVNDGGLDDGVGGVLRHPCCRELDLPLNSCLCGDTNNWDMQMGWAPYHNVTQALYNGSAAAWADDTVHRLRAWSFNTISGYSSGVAERAAARSELYYNRLLMFATRFAEPGGTPLEQATAGGCFGVDVFSITFEHDADEYARQNVAPRAADPGLLGFHFDKEVSWTKMDLRFWLNPSLFPPASAGHGNATRFVRDRYNGSVDKLNRAWGCKPALRGFDELSSCLSSAEKYASFCQRGPDWPPPWPAWLNGTRVALDSEAFLPRVAKRYLGVVHAAIRKYDSDHLLFGPRGGCFGYEPLLPLFAPYLDVIDVHNYGDGEKRSPCKPSW